METDKARQLFVQQIGINRRGVGPPHSALTYFGVVVVHTPGRV